MSSRLSSVHPGLRVGRPRTRLAGSLTVAGALVFGAASCSTRSAPIREPGRAKQFFYSAGALAVGGTIVDIQGKRPEPLLVQAATLLPPSGGMGIGKIGEEGFKYGPVDTPEAKWVITIGSADTSVTGTQERDCYTTKVTNRINDLNVLGRLTAKGLAMEMETRHCLDSETSFRVIRAGFEELKIDGVLLEPEMLKTFGGGRTFSAVAAAYDRKRDGGERARIATRRGKAASSSSRRFEPFGGFSLDRQMLLTSIFAPVGEDNLADLEKANRRPQAGHFELLPDNGIHVPDFGNVYFGRCLINRAKRETAMLHLELGSPVRGPIDIGGEFGNGLPFP